MYKILIKKRAKKFIDKLPQNEKQRIAEALEGLPLNGDIKKMQNHERIYRLRVGDYRIIYEVDNGELVIIVIDAGNRGEIYNRY